jgi:polar amino acid transport system substrate-binding protein
MPVHGAKIGRILLLWLLSWLSLHATAAPALTLRTMSQDGYAGKFNLADPAKPGMMIEVIRAIERADPSLKFSGLENGGPLNRVEYELVDGRIDVFFGMAKTDSRNEKFVFLDTALYQTYYQLAARADDELKVQSMDDIRILGNDGVILINTSESNSSFLVGLGGLVLDKGSSSTASNLSKLVSGRGRFYFGSTLSLVEEIKVQKLGNKVKLLPLKFLHTNIYAVFSKKAAPEAIRRVRSILEALEKAGELKRIYQKYADGG